MYFLDLNDPEEKDSISLKYSSSDHVNCLNIDNPLVTNSLLESVFSPKGCSGQALLQ